MKDIINGRKVTDEFIRFSKQTHKSNEWSTTQVDESEETEVKKDIEWAIKEIEGLKTETSENYPHEKMIEKGIVLGILNQLGEPEVNSQIDKLANFIMSEVEGEPSQSQGAVDTAIRIIKSYQNQDRNIEKWN